MKLKKRTLSALLLLLGLTGLQAQEVIMTSGSNGTGNGGSVSYSVGQVVYTTNVGSGGSVAEGVQQPFEISVLTGFEEAAGITLQYSAFPNPTTGMLNLTIKAPALPDIQKLCYELFDMNGNLLERKMLISSQTCFDMGKLASATYFLKVTEGLKGITSFKIIKN